MNNLIIDEYPLMVLPKLAVKIGLNEAIILQQVHYWLNKSNHIHDDKKWIYNTYEGWQKQFPFWSSRTVRRSLNSLSKQGILITGNFNKAGFDNTKWYSIDYLKLNKLVARPCGQNDQTGRTECPSGSGQNDQTNTRDYTETTSENGGEESENSLQKVIDNYQRNIGILNGKNINDLQVWTQDLPVEVINYAVDIAADNNAQTYSYVNSILKRWFQQNIKTLDQAKANSVKNKRQISNKSNKRGVESEEYGW